jgi:hypothetical protein
MATDGFLLGRKASGTYLTSRLNLVPSITPCLDYCICFYGAVYNYAQEQRYVKRYRVRLIAQNCTRHKKIFRKLSQLNNFIVTAFPRVLAVSESSLDSEFVGAELVNNNNNNNNNFSMSQQPLVDQGLLNIEALLSQ